MAQCELTVEGGLTQVGRFPRIRKPRHFDYPLFEVPPLVGLLCVCAEWNRAVLSPLDHK
jgi:hypothetical protein